MLWAVRLLGFGAKEKRTTRKHIVSAVSIVCLSVIPIIIAIVLTNGMTTGITSKFINLSSFHAQLYSSTDASELVQSARQEDGILDAFEIMEGYCLMYAKDGSYNSMVTGVNEDFLNSTHVTDELEIIDGTWALDGEEREILISEATADELHLTVDDTVAVVSIIESEGSTRIKPMIFHVRAIFASGYQQLDQQLAYIHLDQAERLMRSSNQKFVGVIADQQLSQDIAGLKEIGDRLTSGSGGVITWDQLNRSLYNNFTSSKTILYVIMMLIIVIASIHVASTSIIIIQEKHLAIGMMKSLGISMKVIKRTFIYTSMFIGFIGSILGIIIGLILSSQINSILNLLSKLETSALDFYLVHIPVIVRWDEIMIVAVSAVVLSTVSAWIPLQRIKTITPIHMIQD